MELLKELLVRILVKEDAVVLFPNLQADIAELLELECVKALQKIKLILEDDSSSDAICFKRIEEVVNVFEEIGSHGGNRHDFG